MSDTALKSNLISFVAYTLLGYLALVLHHWIFVPELANSVTALRVILVMANLTAGGWCFLRALRIFWLPGRKVDDRH